MKYNSVFRTMVRDRRAVQARPVLCQGLAIRLELAVPWHFGCSLWLSKTAFKQLTSRLFSAHHSPFGTGNPKERVRRLAGGSNAEFLRIDRLIALVLPTRDGWMTSVKRGR